MANFRKTSIIFFFLIIGPLQLPAQNYWAGFNSINYDGDYFYAVADQMFEIVKINKEGKVIDKFGRRGKGPAEFGSDDLKILVKDDLLYVLDSRFFNLTILNKHEFDLIENKKLSKPVSDIINVGDNIYGLVTDFEDNNPFETGTVVKAARKIDSLEFPKANLFKYQDQNPINPFYDNQRVYSRDGKTIITMSGKNSFFFFNGKTIDQINIPFIEPQALGQEISGNTQVIETEQAKVFWKEKKLPKYQLVKSAFLYNDMAYFHVKSIQSGNLLISYNLDNKTFKKIGTLSQGTMIAVDGDTVFTIVDGDVIKNSMGQIAECSQESITFYLSNNAFEEQCSMCTSSFYEWYDFANESNIPVKIILEDDSWFGSKRVDTEIIEKLIQWNVWGEIEYKKDCKECFDGSLKSQIINDKKAKEYVTFPAPIEKLKNNLRCLTN